MGPRKGSLFCKYFPKIRFFNPPIPSAFIIQNMKSHVFSLCSFLLLFSVISCGKKAKVDDNNDNDNELRPTTAEIYFNALKEIERSVLENDLPSLKKTVFESPGIDLNQILHNGETFLIIAIKKDYREIRNFLIEKGVQLDKANVNKETPLIAAVANNLENSVKVLLDLKVDLERKDFNGDTALHVAIKKSNDEIALLLIKQGANVEATDRRERNAYKLAELYQVPNSRDLIRSILQIEVGAPDLAGYRAILVQGDHKRLNQILNRYPNIANDDVYDSINPLALLVGVNDETSAMRSAELLINYNANVNGPLGADMTPLIKATVEKKKSFAKLFLSNNASTELNDAHGKSALIHAVEMNNLELVDLLLSYSAVENYTLRKDGKKISFSACDIAREVAKTLETKEEKDINEEIKEQLDCGFFNWLF